MSSAFAVHEEPGSKRTLRHLFSLLPFEMRITGRRRDIGMYLMDHLYPPPPSTAPMEKMSASDGRQFLLDMTACNQRLLSGYYDNLLRHYRTSALNRVLLEVAGAQDPPGTFLDVGGNLGIYSLLARDAGFDTVVVEAEPQHAEFLSRHPDLYPRVFSVAVGDKDSTARFFVSDSNPGGSSLVSEIAAPADGTNAKPTIYRTTITVRVRRLDSLLADLPDRGASIRMIKIDVEGFEAAVVRGMTDYLEEGHRPVIWCEVRGPDSDRAPDSYQSVCETLASFGYRPHWGERPGQSPFNARETALPQVFDLLFRPGD